MKFKTCVLAVVCLVATLCVFCVPVQAQEEVPLSFFVEEVRVIPDKVGKYEEFVKKFVGICQQYNWTFSMSTYVTMDNLFYFLYPAKSHSDVDQIFKSWNAIIDKYGGEKWQAFMQNYADCFEYMKFGMIHRLPELCYTPKVVAPGEEPFTYWGYLFVKPGMEKDVEAIFKEFVKLFQDKKTPNAFNFYAVDYGLELPCYFYAMGGKSASDMFTKGEKAHEIADAEINTLWKKLSKCLRRYEYKIGNFRPDLSYVPEIK